MFNQETGMLDAQEKELKELHMVESALIKNKLSLREACSYLKEKTNRHLSAPGLKLEKVMMLLKDWQIFNTLVL